MQRTFLLGMICLGVVASVAWYGFTKLSPAPAVTFTLLSGQTQSLAALRGKMVIVHFWATSCPTCIKEIPQFTRLYKQFNVQGLEMFAVTMSYDPPMYVANYTRTRQLLFPVAMDSDGSIARAFGDVQITPTTFLIDQRGNIVKRYVGEPDWAQFETLLTQKLSVVLEK
ncbi:MAG: TlpA family protein disulfide reductase [Ottowia sp.]|nr:TlpA family protein disulfide reductase [Ottowia sp.]